MCFIHILLMLQIHRALFHDLVHHGDPALLYGLEPNRPPVPLYRPLHPDPALYLHGIDRVVQIAHAASPGRFSAFSTGAHFGYRVCNDSSRVLDLYVLFCEETGILRAI